mmetsp:Transcript_76289/g.126556  ORF Transcript_76289/g.126556 Transcript_76289/m.126556 type:complete len:327 (+) Transcript_76289:27-1007(+)
MSAATPLLEDGHAGAICRVCHSGGSDPSPLLSPCLCDGSIRWVHRDCLDKWRAQGSQAWRASRCELCGFTYVYELRQASRLGAIWLMSNKYVFTAIVSAIVFSALVKAYSLLTALVVLGVVCGFWALSDVARALPWLTGKPACRICTSRRGSLVGTTVWELFSIYRLPVAAQQARSLARVQAETADTAEAVAQNLATANPEVEVHEEEAGDDPEEPETERYCCTIACCVQEGCFWICFLAIPPLLAGLSWCLKAFLKLYGLHAFAANFATVFAIVGGAYCLLSLALKLMLVLCWPPMLPRCDDRGLPLVRSLTDEERCASNANQEK